VEIAIRMLYQIKREMVKKMLMKGKMMKNIVIEKGHEGKQDEKY